MIQVIAGALLIVGGLKLISNSAKTAEKKIEQPAKKELTNENNSGISEPSVAKIVPSSENTGSTDDATNTGDDSPE